MKTRTILNTLVIIVATALLSFDMPKGWSPGGTDLKDYEMGLDKNAGRNASSAATIKSITDQPKKFGTMLQSIAPDKFLNKRVRMSGYMKSKDVETSAGFWLRVDQAASAEPLSFDNMSDRPVKATTDWTYYEIVLDVPANASSILFGALLTGTGQIWFDDIKFEIVENTTPTTGSFKKRNKNPDPVNLDFEN